MDSTKAISWGQAWLHCAHTGSYWVGIAIVIILGAAFWLLLRLYERKDNKDMQYAEVAVGVIFVLALAFAICARPCDVASNTSIASAAKGLWLGY